MHYMVVTSITVTVPLHPCNYIHYMTNNMLPKMLMSASLRAPAARQPECSQPTGLPPESEYRRRDSDSSSVIQVDHDV